MSNLNKRTGAFRPLFFYYMRREIIVRKHLYLINHIIKKLNKKTISLILKPLNIIGTSTIISELQVKPIIQKNIGMITD